MAVETLRQRIAKHEIAVAQTFLTVGPSGRLVETSSSPLWLAENGDLLYYKRWGKDFRESQ